MLRIVFAFMVFRLTAAPYPQAVGDAQLTWIAASLINGDNGGAGLRPGREPEGKRRNGDEFIHGIFPVMPYV